MASPFLFVLYLYDLVMRLFINVCLASLASIHFQHGKKEKVKLNEILNRW